jgi:hypothetical protein
VCSLCATEVKSFSSVPIARLNVFDGSKADIARTSASGAKWTFVTLVTSAKCGRRDFRIGHPLPRFTDARLENVIVTLAVRSFLCALVDLQVVRCAENSAGPHASRSNDSGGP